MANGTNLTTDEWSNIYACTTGLTDKYVNTSGDTMTGTLTINTAAANQISLQTDATATFGSDVSVGGDLQVE